MSRRVIWIVTIFMGLAMTALIMVQVYWIKNAVIVNEKQFGQLIQRSMIDIADEIERREVMKIASGVVSPFTTDTSFHSQSQPLRNQSDNDTLSQEEASQGRSNSGDSNNDQTSNQRWLNSRREFVDQIIANMLYVSPDIRDRINQQELEFLIHNNLAKTGIDLDFEFAVTNWNNEIVLKSATYDPTAATEFYNVQLFRNDYRGDSHFLSVYFPGKRNYLYRQLIYLAFSSLILTLAILTSFIITVFIMFRQKRLSEIRSDFVSNMTHELKTPISTISLASQLLSDKSIPDEVKKREQISKIINDECKRLGSQVEKVLQTAVFDKGKLKLKMGEVDMHELIAGVVDNFSLQIQSRSGKIEALLHANDHLITADQVHVTNLLSNLIDNGIKYCNRNPEIIIETINKYNYLVISVKDNGIGLAKNDLKRIFEKFYRVPTGNVHTVKGFGLGLSYVKMIAEEHRGHIEVESEIYKGSTFSVFLPLKESVTYAKH